MTLGPLNASALRCAASHAADLVEQLGLYADNETGRPGVRPAIQLITSARQLLSAPCPLLYCTSRALIESHTALCEYAHKVTNTR